VAACEAVQKEDENAQPDVEWTEQAARRQSQIPGNGLQLHHKGSQPFPRHWPSLATATSALAGAGLGCYFPITVAVGVGRRIAVRERLEKVDNLALITTLTGVPS
jgi:hypothetical protein